MNDFIQKIAHSCIGLIAVHETMGVLLLQSIEAMHTL